MRLSFMEARNSPENWDALLRLAGITEFLRLAEACGGTWHLDCHGSAHPGLYLLLELVTLACLIHLSGANPEIDGEPCGVD